MPFQPLDQSQVESLILLAAPMGLATLSTQNFLGLNYSVHFKLVLDLEILHSKLILNLETIHSKLVLDLRTLRSPGSVV